MRYPTRATLLVLCLLVFGCAVAPVTRETALQLEDKLVAAKLVRPIPDAPLRIIEFFIHHDATGIQQLHLRLFNDTSKHVRAYEIEAILQDDFGRAACAGDVQKQGLTAQEQNIPPGGSTIRLWVLHLCARAMRYHLTVLDVLFTDGSRWRIAGNQ